MPPGKGQEKLHSILPWGTPRKQNDSIFFWGTPIKICTAFSPGGHPNKISSHSSPAVNKSRQEANTFGISHSPSRVRECWWTAPEGTIHRTSRPRRARGDLRRVLPLAATNTIGISCSPPGLQNMTAITPRREDLPPCPWAKEVNGDLLRDPPLPRHKGEASDPSGCSKPLHCARLYNTIVYKMDGKHVCAMYCVMLKQP